VFEMVEHTGDLAVRLRAPDLSGLIREGALALRSVLFEGEPAPGAPAEERAASVRGVDAEDVLVQALSEILHMLQAGDLFPLEVHARAPSDTLADIRVRGVPRSAAGVRRIDEIKAVTYHAVDIHPADGDLETLLVLDV
jgi:SHS2 domain-containing protein